MSVVTGIIVVCDLGGEEEGREDWPVLFDRLNDWCEAHDKGRPLVRIDNNLGGGKHPQFYAAGAGCNHFPEDEFGEYFASLPWRHPENAILIMQPEDGATRVLRPPNPPGSAQMIVDSGSIAG